MKKEKNSFGVEKPGRPLHQGVKVNITNNKKYRLLRTLDVMLRDGHITSEVFFPQICNFNLQGKNIRQPQVEERAANCLTNTLQKASRRD